jgi:hypothetical protein
VGPLVDLPPTDFQIYAVACLHDRMRSGQLLCSGILMLNLGWGWVWCNLETFRITWNMDTSSAFGINGGKTGPVG